MVGARAGSSSCGGSTSLSCTPSTVALYQLAKVRSA